MAHILRRPVGLDVVRVQRSIPKKSVGAVRPAGTGGVGWRPGVPHIVIMAGDVVPACPFPVGYVASEYIAPVSTRGVGSVPVAFMRGSDFARAGAEYPTWLYEYDTIGAPATSFPYGSWYNGVFTFPPNSWIYDRSGTVGESWVAPSNAATLPGTIEALSDLDIAVVTLTDNGVDPVWATFTEAPNELSYSSFIRLYTDWAHTEASPSGIPFLPDPYGGGAVEGLHTTGAAMAALTGAVIDDPATTDPTGEPALMSYKWGRAGTFGDPRWATPTDTDASEFVEFLAPRLIQLAGQLGNATTFDIALLIDNSGSFTGSDTIGTRVFADLITRLRAEERDIFVAVSRYSEYSDWSFPHAGTSLDDRPFMLMYPMSSIADDADFNLMIASLDDSPPGNGGDAPEANYEGLYQIATGAGFDGSADRTETTVGVDGPLILPDGNLTMSGEATVRGATVAQVDVDGIYTSGSLFGFLLSIGYTDAEANAFIARHIQPHVSQGLGYMVPGYSGDVPSFEGQAAIRRGAAATNHKQNQIWTYPKS